MARIWILGGGLIGCGWAAAFAGAGHEVTVIDPDPAVADIAFDALRVQGAEALAASHAS